MRSLFFDAQHRLRNGWKSAAFFAGAALCFVAVGISSKIVPHEIKVFFPNALLVMLGILLLSKIAVRLEGKPLSSIGLRLDASFLRQWLGGAVAGALLILASALLVMTAGGFHWVAATPPTWAAQGKTVLMFLGGAVFEELAMRGYAFQRAIRGVGTGWAIVIFGIIFLSLIHI